MFNTLECIWAGFSGGLRAHGEARRLVWLLLVTFIFGLGFAAFAAWVSYPSYRALVEYLPGADIVAWAFTAGVAAFLYFSFAYIAGFAVERWKGVPAAARNYSALGFRILLICAAVFFVADMYMNMQGKDHRATAAAGDVVQFTYATPADQVVRLAADREKLREIEGGKIGGYGWRDPKTGTFWLNNSGKRATVDLRASIRRTEQADSLSRSAFLVDVQTANRGRDEREVKVKATLKNAVYGVYVFIMILCIAQGYIVEVIQAATGANDARIEAATERAERRKKPEPSKTTEAGQGSAIRPEKRSAGYAPAIAQTGDQGGGYRITCHHCGEQAVMKSPAARYCGDECREAAWEQKNGVKITKGKGGKPTKKLGYK